MYRRANPLALDPLGPIGIGPIAAFSSSKGPLGLDPLSPITTVSERRDSYFGAELSERTLVPGEDARLGETRFEDWLRQPANSPRPRREQAHAGAKVTT
jgi:hypothetical protein